MVRIFFFLIMACIAQVGVFADQQADSTKAQGVRPLFGGGEKPPPIRLIGPNQHKSAVSEEANDSAEVEVDGPKKTVVVLPHEDNQRRDEALESIASSVGVIAFLLVAQTVAIAVSMIVLSK